MGEHIAFTKYVSWVLFFYNISDTPAAFTLLLSL